MKEKRKSEAFSCNHFAVEKQYVLHILMSSGVLDVFSTHPRHQPAASWVITTRYRK
jgi:hypothetical protein